MALYDGIGGNYAGFRRPDRQARRRAADQGRDAAGRNAVLALPGER